jgi:NhaP-type Na+/H+ or K+/H+ antiporter
VTTDQILIGIGLTLALAVGCQVAASRLHVPALILLLPAGFTAGALTVTVHPDQLLGPAFQPLVSLSVAVILYDAGLSLDLTKLVGSTRRVALRLIGLGVAVTCVLAALTAARLLGLSGRSALMLGTILVVSGPTVVGPILRFVHPVQRLHRILTWEGALIDPIGAILGALVFHAVTASVQPGLAAGVGQFLISVGVGVAGAAVGSVVLWLLLTKLDLDEAIGTSTQLATVVAVAAACDALRDDTGLVAAIGMGLVVANHPQFDVPARRPFLETLVQLILGVLFISISATVTPASLRHLLLPTLALVAVLVLVARPLVAFGATVRAGLSRGERGFIGWMAPRGIVAAATASTFSAGLAAQGVAGADEILPVTFLVIVVTVGLYGLTAEPVARRLGVVRSARSRPLLVGDEDWMLRLGRVLQAGGLDVLMWAGLPERRAQIRDAGLELAPGELLAAATGRGAELEGVTTVLVLTGDDDFNVLASMVLRPSVDGPVYHLRPAGQDREVIAPVTAGQSLFAAPLTRPVLADRCARGAQFSLCAAAEEAPPGHDVLFVLGAEGRLLPVTEQDAPTPRSDGQLVLLGPALPQPPTSLTEPARRTVPTATTPTPPTDPER